MKVQIRNCSRSCSLHRSAVHSYRTIHSACATMPSHAKHNTTQSTLTAYERNLLRAANKPQRLGPDSFKRIDSCYLCLARAQAPVVACPSGHIYCKECIVASLLSQKAGIKRQQAELIKYGEDEERERAEARTRARERVLRDFQRGMGLGGPNGTSKEVRALDTPGEDRGTKRKFEFDHDQVERIALEAEEKAMKAIEAEQQEARKAKLPAFWLPQLMPGAKLDKLQDVKLQTMCNVGEPHPLTMKQLLPVVFTYAPAAQSASSTPTSTPHNPITPNSVSSSSTPPPVCPSCSKEISNATKSVLLVSKVPAGGERKKDSPSICGHVVCHTCAETIVKPSKACVVCEAQVRPDKDIVDLGKEGTGFAAAGGAEVKKAQVAFRV